MAPNHDQGVSIDVSWKDMWTTQGDESREEEGHTPDPVVSGVTWVAHIHGRKKMALPGVRVK